VPYPLEELDPLARVRAKARRIALLSGQAPAAPESVLTDPEVDSLLWKITKPTLGIASGVANLMDIPGSAVRDIAGGRKPWDQLFSPFSSDDRLTGRDLLRQYGLAGKRDTWGNFLAGIGLEIAGDPLTYLGGLGVIGKGLKAAGLLGDVAKYARPAVGRLRPGLREAMLTVRPLDIVQRAATPQDMLQNFARLRAAGITGTMWGEPIAGGVVRLRGPLRALALGREYMLTGRPAHAVARGLDVAERSLPRLPVVGALETMRRGLFGARYRGQMDPYAQELAARVTEETRRIMPESRMAGFAEEESLGQALRSFGTVNEQEIMASARRRIVDPAEAVLARARGMVEPRASLDWNAFDALAAAHPLAGSRVIRRALPIQHSGTLTELAVPVGGRRRTAELAVANLEEARSVSHTIKDNAKRGFAGGFYNVRVHDTGFGYEVRWGREQVGEAIVYRPTLTSQERLKKALGRFHAAENEFAALDVAEEVRRVSNVVARTIGETGDVAQAAALADLRISGAGSVPDVVQAIQDGNRQGFGDLLEMGAASRWLDDSIGTELRHVPRSADIGRLSYRDRQAVEAALNREAQSRGVPVENLDKATIRRVSEEVAPTRAYRVAATRGPAVLARTKQTAGLPSVVIDQMLTDPALRATGEHGLATAAQHILDTDYVKWLDPTYESSTLPQVAYSLARWTERNAGRPGFPEMLQRETARLAVSPNAANAISQHAWELAQHIRSSSRRPRYTHEMIVDQLRYREALSRNKAMLLAVHSYLRQNAGKGAVSLEEVYRQANMEPAAALQYFARTAGLTVEQAQRLGVSQQVANGVSAVMKTQPGSAWGQAVGDTIDWVLDLYRSNYTLPFLSYHARNLGSGQYVNVATGAMQSPRDLLLYTQQFPTTHRLLREAERAHRSGVPSNNPILQELEAHEVIHAARGGQAIDTQRGFMDVTPSGGLLPEEYFGSVARAQKKMLAVAGRAQHLVEWHNRVPLYLYFRAKGYTALQAALEVKNRHFDYRDLTPFERTIMRRSVLFYSFSRFMAPLILENLIQRPGGALAQTLRVMSRSRETTRQPIPEYMEETTMVPLGRDEEGTLRFITGFGLPLEDTLKFVRSPTYQLLSRTPPPIQGVLELGFGRSIFQRGRELEDLDPPLARLVAKVRGQTGRIEGFHPLIEQTFAKSPLSRYGSFAGQLAELAHGDWRQIPNLVSGLRVARVTKPVQEAIIRERNIEAFKALGGETFRRTYLPEGIREQASPEQLRQIEQHEALTEWLLERSRQRRASRELARRP
jgi:hypothetical protein